MLKHTYIEVVAQVLRAVFGNGDDIFDNFFQ